MTDVFTAPLREADEQFARAADFCASGCTAPVVATEPEPLCERCKWAMRAN